MDFIRNFRNIILIISVFFSFKINSLEKLYFKESVNYKFLFNQSCNSKSFFKNLVKHSSYPKFGKKKDWKEICRLIKKKNVLDYEFFKKNFNFIKFKNKPGILTGYYIPEINVSQNYGQNYKYPILKSSKLLLIERKNILENFKSEDVLLWTDNKIDLFFLQIQGSGVGVFENGKKVKLEYGGNNGFKYSSIGYELIKRKVIDSENISMLTIKKWLNDNESKIDEIFNINKRFIFFSLQYDFNENVVGAMGINLHTNQSIAVDKKIYPYGIPIIIKTNEEKYSKLVFSHDTGAAIKGENRADLFLGRGLNASKEAGNLKKTLHLMPLVPYSIDYDK